LLQWLEDIFTLSISITALDKNVGICKIKAVLKEVLFLQYNWLSKSHLASKPIEHLKQIPFFASCFTGNDPLLFNLLPVNSLSLTNPSNIP